MTIQLSRRTVALALAAFLAFAGLATVSFVRTLAPAEAGGPAFADTPPWIADHAAWLADNGIADGFPGNLFKPNDNITRGQAAFWFGNYNNSLELVSNAFDFDTTTTQAGSFAACPRGKRAVAGGHEGPGWPFVVERSVPFEFEGTWEWQVDWVTQPAAPIGVVTVWVLCAPNTIPTNP